MWAWTVGSENLLAGRVLSFLFYIYLQMHPCIDPFAPGTFAKKTRFEASQAVFWSLSCYKELTPYVTS